jgi:hypothetical protein
MENPPGELPPLLENPPLPGVLPPLLTPVEIGPLPLDPLPPPESSGPEVTTLPPQPAPPVSASATHVPVAQTKDRIVRPSLSQTLCHAAVRAQARNYSIRN